MDVSPKGLLLNLTPKAPSILLTSALAALGKSQNATEQDWAIETLVALAKPILSTPSPLLSSQRRFCQDPGVFGHSWVATYTVPSPSGAESNNSASNIAEAVQFAIETLASKQRESIGAIPVFASTGVEAEWTSYRHQARPWTRPPKGLPQQQIYNASLADTPQGEDSPVILYAHGGAFCLMDPSNHRLNTVDLSRATQARVLNVRYRLSPQAVFPAALMDMFLCYLALLSPPPGAFHKAVPAHRIILAGDSSGGNLAMALQVLLLALVQHGKNLIVNPWDTSTAIAIPNPPSAGLSLSSPWLDITRSLPSQRMNERWDFIAPASILAPDLLSTSPLFPADEIWPASPQRTETYCEATQCAHPLVSPLMTPISILKDFPSTYICTGWEGMTDESEVLARRIWIAKRQILNPFTPPDASDDSIPDSGYASASEIEDHSEIVFDGYTGMPHTFSIIPFHHASKAAKARRASHIRRMTSKNSLPSRATWTRSKLMTVESYRFVNLGMENGAMSGYKRVEPLTDERVFDLVNEGAEFRINLEKRLRENGKLAPISEPSLMIQMLWAIIFRVRDLIFALFYFFMWKWMQW